MKHKKRLVIFCLLILLILNSRTIFNKQVSTQVQDNVTNSLNYKEIVYPGSGYIEFVSTSTEHINYYFEKEKYTEEQIDEFISKVVVLRNILENKYEISFEEKLSIYVSEKNILYGKDRKIFIDSLSIETVDVTVAFLQSIFGDTSNYGLCYGIACYINENLYNVSFSANIENKNFGQYYSVNENLYLMDLTIPVFQNIYFSEEQNSYAYSTAYYFVKDLIERKGLKYSIDLLKKSSEPNIDFDIEYTNEKNVWLKNIGAALECEVSAIPMRYELVLGKKAEIYPYMIHTPSTVSYFDVEEYSKPTELGISYGKRGKYTIEEMTDFLNRIQNFCDVLKNEGKVSFEKPISIYINIKNSFKLLDRDIYLSDLNIEPIDIMTSFLQSLYGSNINYGLCYGISSYVNEKTDGIETTFNISTKELGQYYSSNITIMDLTIPVFQTIYFSEEQNNYAYSTAYYFVKDLINRKGFKYTIDLLKNSANLDVNFDIEYAHEKNIWLTSIGATKKYEHMEIPIRYEQNFGSDKTTYPYIIYTPSTISYFTCNGEFESDKVVMDYEYIKHYMTMYENDISSLREYLSSYFDTKKDVIHCYYNENFDGSFYTSESYDTKAKIKYLEPIWNGVHEYAHYITWKDSMPLWMIEGIAEYCSRYLENKDVYRIGYEYYNKNIANNEEMDKDYLKFNNELSAYRMTKKIKTAKETISWYDLSRKDQEGADLSYSEAASLVNYLVDNYGEEKFFKLFDDYSNSKLKKAYGKGFKELKEEWLVKLNNSVMLEYVLGPDEFKITFTDTSDQYLPSKRSFIDMLDGKTYEYVDCGLGLNKDDERDPNANNFEGLDLKGKIALIQRGTKGINFFYKQVNNAAKAGAVGVIVYNNESGYVNMSLKGVEQDIPAIAILMEDGEFLKNAKDKRVTISKDFIGIIDNNSSDN